MKSILQTDRSCYFCGSVVGLEEHHIFAGTANRKISEKYGLSDYTRERIEILELGMDSLFNNDRVKKCKLTDFF